MLKSGLLVFVSISVVNITRVSGANLPKDLQTQNTTLENICNGYCFSILAHILDNSVKIIPSLDTIDELKGTVKDLQFKLAIAEEQLKCKEDLIKEKNYMYTAVNSEKTEQLKYKDNIIKLKEQQIEDLRKEIKNKDDKINNMTVNIFNIQSQLVSSEGQIKVKEELLNIKVWEINEKSKLIKNKDDLIQINYQEIKEKNEIIKNYEDKVSNMTSTIQGVQSRLQNSEDQLKIKEDLLSIRDTKIIEKSEELKKKDLEIKDQNDLIKNKDEEIKSKRAQILTKDNQIDGLNNQIKTVSKELFKCNITEGCHCGGKGGIYQINRTGMDLFEVPCNTDGWMILQRRQDGSENFNRYWQDYKDGFGNIKGEFFIGLEKLHQLTKKPHELYVKLVDFDGNSRYATYDNFEIGSEEELYVLKSVGTYNGTAGDALTRHVNKKFSTVERDNDNSNSNCALNNSGGWWFDDCLDSALNGKYHKTRESEHQKGIHWDQWHGYYTSLSFVEMMIRPN